MLFYYLINLLLHLDSLLFSLHLFVLFLCFHLLFCFYPLSHLHTILDVLLVVNLFLNPQSSSHLFFLKYLLSPDIHSLNLPIISLFLLMHFWYKSLYPFVLQILRFLHLLLFEWFVYGHVNYLHCYVSHMLKLVLYS